MIDSCRLLAVPIRSYRIYIPVINGTQKLQTWRFANRKSFLLINFMETAFLIHSTSTVHHHFQSCQFDPRHSKANASQTQLTLLYYLQIIVSVTISSSNPSKSTSLMMMMMMMMMDIDIYVDLDTVCRYMNICVCQNKRYRYAF